jgi:hypothetical protein
MKPLITLGTLFIILIGVVFVLVTELYSENRVLKSDIKGLQNQADSLERVTKLQSDTIRIAKNTILLQADTITTYETEKKNYKRDTHEQIHFIDLRTDARRDSTLSNLYPSFRPVR